MQLFYSPDINEDTVTFSFQKEESKHIAKVLRKKEGDVLHITNGKGWLFIATIVQATVKTCEVAINESKKQV
ncbi:MAG: 16S rRNA (uracil(1498)-N(3))-methyltransferase, partial [Bacteroidetes bacterium]|nr:16S rRNA (uracil(1498)-N(3))-methyltransferase [Bacteroidota bacterium]